ncbi:uncharacterized protein [Diabrotica undecimpunctata]|uniref:uncharacterized protein n=1 Tax=Diabrotica undecimpunctata TaxID=50387 RepID=UPI003B635F62
MQQSSGITETTISHNTESQDPLNTESQEEEGTIDKPDQSVENITLPQTSSCQQTPSRKQSASETFKRQPAGKKKRLDNLPPEQAVVAQHEIQGILMKHKLSVLSSANCSVLQQNTLPSLPVHMSHSTPAYSVSSGCNSHHSFYTNSPLGSPTSSSAQQMASSSWRVTQQQQYQWVNSSMVRTYKGAKSDYRLRNDV